MIEQVQAIEQEIQSQPESWRRAARHSARLSALVGRDSRLAFIGCGTSFHIARASAGLVEANRGDECDAFPASECPTSRRYDSVVAISRSGTTSEVTRALRAFRAGVRKIAISAVARSPVVDAAEEAVILDFADERSIVQTRFATSALMLVRAAVGHDVEAISRDGERALDMELPVDPSRFRRFVFLSQGWAVGLCDEAGLKLRESCGQWCEAYPALEFRHGPISACDEGTLVWGMGPMEGSLVREIEATGSTVLEAQLDPVAELILVQRMALQLATLKGLDADRPRYLKRSVILDGD